MGDQGHAEPQAAERQAPEATAGGDDASPLARRAGQRTPSIPDTHADGAAAEDAETVDVAGHELELVRAQLAEAQATVKRLERERDVAVAQRKAAHQELETLRQSHEKALLDARAEERDKAADALAEGAELRARLERERHEAFAVRDAALRERDEAEAAKAAAQEERKQALADRKAALRQAANADKERDRALREADDALTAREKAFQERDDAITERDQAVHERDAVISAHERGLPVRPPQPRFLPPEPGPPAPIDVWIPRAVAVSIVAIFLVVVLRLFLG